MGRTLGIPTRYVEGYITPNSPDSTGAYQITGELAHAWTEAYFPEFGWIAFEPTSIYHYEDYAPPEPLLPEEPAPPEAPDTPPSEPLLPTEPEDARTDTPMPEALEPAVKSTPFRKVLTALFLVLLLGLLVLSGYLLYKRYQKEQVRREQLSGRKAVLAYYLLTEKLLSFLGYAVYPQETPLAFAKRIQPTLSDLLLDFDLSATIYSKAAYSQESITEQEAAFVKNVYEELFDRLNNATISLTKQSASDTISWKGKLSFWFAHFILLTV